MVRSRSKRLGIAADFYQKNDIHIHLPKVRRQGWPSAASASATPMVSAADRNTVRADVP